VNLCKIILCVSANISVQAEPFSYFPSFLGVDRKWGSLKIAFLDPLMYIIYGSQSAEMTHVT
jgi:hypothetical protein